VLRPLAPALVLAFAALALAGCIAGSEPLTGRGAADVALPAARANWHADAQVAWVQGVERDRFEAPEQGLNLTDGRIGDGHGPLWGVWLVSPATPDEAYLMVVQGNRTILREGAENLTSRTGGGGVNVTTRMRLYPAADWRIDSNQAAVAAHRNATWAALLPRAGAAQWHLYGAPNASHPVWVAVLVSRERLEAQEGGWEDVDPQGHVAMVVVDATTGDLLDHPPAWLDEVMDVDVGFGPGQGFLVQERRGGFDGTLTRATPDEAHPFAIGEGHPELRVVVRAQPPSPAATLEVVLVLPDGSTLQAEAGTSPAEIVVEQPPAGDYTVEVHLGGPAGGIAARYAGCWVAQGFAATIPTPFPSGC
jgi:hypothetical protein